MPTHCYVEDSSGMTGHQGDIIVPVIQDPPAPNIMDPALQSGLYNPNASVRRGAVEALGKMYGVNVLRKVKKEESDAKARVKSYASKEAKVPFTLRILTNEELAAFAELVEEEEEEEEKEEKEEEETRVAEGNGGDEKLARLEKEGEKTAVGAATPEKVGEEKTVEVEHEGKEPLVGATVERVGEDNEGIESRVGAVIVEIKGKEPTAGTSVENVGEEKTPVLEKMGMKPTEKQQKKKQPKPPPVGTAWFLRRGQELDSKRTH